MPVHFFNTKQKPNKLDNPCNFIAVGGDKYSAMAVSIIEKIQEAKESTTELNDISKKILTTYFEIYPDDLTGPAYSNAFYKMKLLLKSTPRMGDIKKQLADTFIQMTWDEIFKKPTKYPEILEGRDPNTTKEDLRQETPTHPRALDALKNALGIKNITLNRVEPGKNFRGRAFYEEETQRAPVYDNAMKRSML